MKVINLIFRYLFAVILAICLSVLIVINNISSTIFDKNFVLNQLEETGYYDKLYERENSNFENFLNISGIDKSVIEGVFTREDIVNDTLKIIDNVFENKEEKVTIENIKNRFNENVEKAIQNGIITAEQKNSLNMYLEEISNDYLNSIAYYDCQKDIYNEFHKMDFVLNIADKVMLIFAAVAFFGVIVACGSKFFRFFLAIGVIVLSTGLFLIVGNIIFNININALNLVNDGFSFMLKEMTKVVFGQILIKGILLLFCGGLIIYVSNIVHKRIDKNKNKDKEEIKEKNKEEKKIENI